MSFFTSTDKDLLARVAAGDERAFRRLFDRHQPRIYSFALSLTRSTALAEDLVQEVFTRVWSRRVELRDVLSFEAYSRVIVRNVASTYLKWLACERLILLELGLSAPVSARTTEEEVFANEFRRLLDEAVASLSPRQREIFLLHRQGGVTQEEIARRLGLSFHTVKGYMKQALTAIRAHVERGINLVILLEVQRFLW
jgi:RNA polymerase sigma-70 factor (ECF subfamily)